MTGSDAAHSVAAIDLGTVSSRLVLAQVADGAILSSSKHTEITDLGEGVDATGRFCEAAVERVLTACRVFVKEARGLVPNVSAPRARVRRAMPRMPSCCSTAFEIWGSSPR